MPKAILEFNLPEEQEEFTQASTARSMFSVLWDFSQDLRSWLKHGHPFKTADEALEAARSKFYEILENNNIILN